MDTSTLTVEALAATIDHAILKPELTREDVDAQLDVAAATGVFSACVRPSDVAHAVARLHGTGVAVGTVIGFPHGTTSTGAKVAEAEIAVEDGAVELDMVLNIASLRSGFVGDVEDDIRAVVEAAGSVPVKVILETSLLDDEQKRAGCQAAEAAGAAFVKTSTGFAGGGATPADIRLMRDAVGAGVAVKASGGVRSLDNAIAVLEAGADRLGTSASETLLADLRTRLETGEPLAGAVDRDSY